MGQQRRKILCRDCERYRHNVCRLCKEPQYKRIAAPSRGHHKEGGEGCSTRVVEASTGSFEEGTGTGTGAGAGASEEGQWQSAQAPERCPQCGHDAVQHFSSMPGCVDCPGTPDCTYKRVEELRNVSGWGVAREAEAEAESESESEAESEAEAEAEPEPEPELEDPEAVQHDPLIETIWSAIRPRVVRIAETHGGGGSGPITVTTPEGLEVGKIEGITHHELPTVVRLASARVNAYMVGPAGTGKTYMGQQAAEALGLAFYPKSVGPATVAHELMGYMDANGRYVPGLMFEPFANGGLLLLDELDAGNPAAITTLNTALANDYCSFPHDVVHKHPDCVMLASANTLGMGADAMYTGRNAIDAASLDRFAYVHVGYDENVERARAGGMIEALSGSAPQWERKAPKIASKYPADDDRTADETADLMRQWSEHVWAFREAVEETDSRVVVSTRAIIMGSECIRAGFTLQAAADLKLWGALDDDTAERVYEALPAAEQLKVQRRGAS